MLCKACIHNLLERLQLLYPCSNFACTSRIMCPLFSPNINAVPCLVHQGHRGNELHIMHENGEKDKGLVIIFNAFNQARNV